MVTQVWLAKSLDNAQDIVQTRVKIISNYPITGLAKSRELQEFETLTISRKPSHKTGKVVSPTHWPPLPRGNISGTISVRGAVDLRNIAWRER
jgi:hypothetical protein